MRVLLINPYYPLTEMPSPPLGLAYVAAAFERAGAEVRIWDHIVEPFSTGELRVRLQDFAPDIIGATCVTMTFDAAIEALEAARQAMPGALTIMGGPHVSYRAEKTLEEHPCLDMIVMGEGEVTVSELVDRLDRGAAFDDVAGLAFRAGDQIRVTASRPPGMNVNAAPLPARHLLKLGRYRALGLAITMITSRGCPFQCIFCVGRRMSGAKVRYRRAKDVVDEMEWLGSLGFSQINIADDLFTAKKSHCFEICDEIISRGLRLKWTVFSRANTISPELLVKLKAAGCSHVSFGFETADPAILKTVNKRITREQMLRAVEMCRDAGMPAQASFITGLPGETSETIRRNIEFADHIHGLGTDVGFHLLAPFPGTAVRDQAKEYGLEILSNHWADYTANRAIVQPHGVSVEEMEARPMELEQMVVEQLAGIQQRIEQGTATAEEAASYHSLRRMDIFYRLMMANMVDDQPEQLSKTGEGDEKATRAAMERTASTLLESMQPQEGPLSPYTFQMILQAIEDGMARVHLGYDPITDRLLWLRPAGSSRPEGMLPGIRTPIPVTERISA